MSAAAGLLLALALWPRATHAQQRPRAEESSLEKLEEEMVRVGSELAPLVERLEGLRMRCRFAGWLGDRRLSRERSALEDSFQNAMTRLHAAQAAYDDARRDLRAKKKFRMFQGAMVGRIPSEGYTAPSAQHKKYSSKTDALIDWADAALRSEAEACSAPERRRAALLKVLRWAALGAAAAAALAAALYFAFVAAP